MSRSAFKPLLWAGAAATVLVGVIIALTTGVEDPEPLAAGIFGVCLGLTMELITADALVTGEVRVRTRHARREDSPGAFWIAVALYGLSGAAITVASLALLLGG